MSRSTNGIRRYKLMSKCHVCRIIPKENKDKSAITITLEEFKNKPKMHHLDKIAKNSILTPLSLDIPNDKL